MFIPMDTHYDVEGSTNDFAVHSNLNDFTSSSTKKMKLEVGSEATAEKEDNNKIRNEIMKLCEGDATTYIRQSKQLELVIKGNLNDTTNSKFVIMPAMSYMDLTNIKAEYVSSFEKEIVTKKTDESGVTTEVQTKRRS